VIVHGDEDAQLPFLTVHQMMRRGLDCVSLIFKNLSHWLNSPLSAAGPYSPTPANESFMLQSIGH
jgi:hypothetical protein